MKGILKKYMLIKWWIPLMLFMLASFVFLLLISSTNDVWISLSDYFMLTTIILLFIAGVWQLIKGKWYLGLMQLFTLFAGIVGLFVVVTFMSMLGPDTNTFAANRFLWFQKMENCRLPSPEKQNKTLI